ncbi:hypothetical protein [Phaeobacter sp.]|uniref:hypothetical protein n=1 Tax=Phaeobacter sp. TaxID=1902409 RepID=UPI00260081EA|nr:hypothetical protein [Phaeobacter sp.]
MVAPHTLCQPLRSATPLGPRAVVIGGGVAGLAAASALAPHVASITLIEQEALPVEPLIRRHTPQAPHVHALLDSGRQALEKLMPGFGAALQSAGSLPLRVRSQWRSHDGHAWCAPEDTGPVVLSQSRALFEHVLRQRVLALPHLSIEIARVRGLRLAPTENDTRQPRITGVDLEDQTRRQKSLSAEIVVDASGRAGDTLKWFKAAGLQPPTETTRCPDIRYVSACFARLPADPAHLPSAWLRPAQAPATQGLVMAPIEDGRWVVTLIGRFGAAMPRDAHGFRQRMLELAGPELQLHIKGAPMLSPLRGFAIKSVRFRRFDRTARELPLGYFPIGDTIATFNPLYGQGMSVAALQAQALSRALYDNTQPVDQQAAYLAAAHSPADWAWTIGGAVDRAYTQMCQQEDAACDHLAARLRLAFSASVLRSELRGQIDRVLHLLEPPDKLDAFPTEPV